MAVTLTDPRAAAQAQAAFLRTHGDMVIEGALQRVLADAPFADADSLVSGLEAFHRERMAKVPSAARYPEAQPWVDHVLAVDKELQALAGLTDRQLAIYRSLGQYLTFRGYGIAKPVQVERCRIIYLPDSDRGEFHIKNVDDPKTFWTPRPHPAPARLETKPLNWDGVGSGLHMDDEPEEIFPLPYRDMVFTLCDDVPGAVAFLTRYAPFWGGQNIVLWDRQRRNVAIEKCSHNFIEVFSPGENGGSHCSGMACRNPQSPQGQYQTKQRLAYLTKFHQPLDGPDMTFWQACDRAEAMLGALMKNPRPTTGDIIALFTTPWPQGLNKPGIKVHPDQAMAEYTLAIHAEFYTERTVYYWQRDAFGNAPCAPTIYRY